VGKVAPPYSPIEELSEMSIQAVLYLIAVILVALAALPFGTRGINLALLGAAFALLAYSWGTITG
jgi:hypothetical protein